MDKYINLQSRGITSNSCDEMCIECQDCKRDPRGRLTCWEKCDDCNRCAAASYRNNATSRGWGPITGSSLNEFDAPYYYVHPWGPDRTLDTTPLSKQFSAGVCGVNTARAYDERIDNYRMCKTCEIRGQCWSPYENRCIECPADSSPGRCEDKWGCPNQNGAEFGFRPPVDPMFTNCKPCWL